MHMCSHLVDFVYPRNHPPALPNTECLHHLSRVKGIVQPPSTSIYVDIQQNQDHHTCSMTHTSISLGALGRENEEKFPREQKVHRLEKVVLALLDLSAKINGQAVLVSWSSDHAPSIGTNYLVPTSQAHHLIAVSVRIRDSSRREHCSSVFFRANYETRVAPPSTSLSRCISATC